jgi:hypothetical protein
MEISHLEKLNSKRRHGVPTDPSSVQGYARIVGQEERQEGALHVVHERRMI